MGTVNIRYIGPLTDGVWTDHEHGAHDFAHGDFVEVSEALARDLLGQLEPVPPGDPVFNEEQQCMVTALAPVWELADGDSIPGFEPAAAPAKPRKAARKGARR